MTQSVDAPQGLGLRELQKRNKLASIKAAARSVFISRGYEDASTRDIAMLAEVSHATIFVYAQDKRDLLFLVFNDDMDRVLSEAVAATREPAPLVERLTRWYTPFLHFFGSEMPISLLAMHERSIVAASDTAQGLSVKRRGDIARTELTGLIQAAIDAGELRPDIDPATALRVIRSVFFSELERWFIANPRPRLARALEELRATLDLVVRGLQLHS